MIYRFHYRAGAVIAVLTAILSAPVTAEPDPDTAAKHLFGNWGNAQPYFQRHGIEVNAVLTLESVNVIQGGLKRASKVLGNFDLTTKIDTHTAGWWDNGTFFLYVLGDAGGDPTSIVGDMQATSNIEAYDTTKIFEAWYQHQFGDQLNTLVGLYNYNCEFYTLQYAATLFTSSFGIGPDASQTGPSIFPTTALAARLNYTASNGLYVLGALFDGVPGDPADPRGTQIILKPSDGIFSALEIGYNTKKDAGDPEYTKVGIGAWNNTQDFVDSVSGNDRSNNSGLYVIGETTLKQGIGVFLQLGAARKDRNQIGNYLGAGLYCAGLFHSRSDDVFALGVAQARNSKEYRAANPGSERDETVLEVNYMMQVNPWLVIQPDVQYVMHPGTDPTVKDALVAGARIKLAF